MPLQIRTNPPCLSHPRKSHHHPWLFLTAQSILTSFTGTFAEFYDHLSRSLTLLPCRKGPILWSDFADFNAQRTRRLRDPREHDVRLHLWAYQHLARTDTPGLCTRLYLQSPACQERNLPQKSPRLRKNFTKRKT